MKNKVKVILFLIITLFLFSFATNEVFASENINYEPKIYCELNVEDDFSLDSVLVMIDKNLSDVNKVFEKSFFGNLDIINIEDLTYRENWNNNVDIKEENFRQTLELHLESQTKDSIISIIKNLEKIDGIVCASPNYIGTNGLVTISDANYHRQWGLSNTNGINAEQAWDFVIGSREVRVGILDTGITPHVDLNDNLISGFSYIDDNTNDDDDHGSHVAGIVGAVGNTLGISGVARKISLVPMKFDGDIGDVQSALTDAETNNIRIVNMSWWNFPNNPILRNAINTFDGLFVCIAGNGDTDIETKPNYPASFNLDNMIVVGAIKSDSSRPTVSDWGYDSKGKPQGSNYGSNTVDLFAPGDNIYSTVPTNSYATMGGTSMAAPHVAGVAALLLSINPNLTTQQLRTAILESVDIPNVNGSNPLEDLCVTDGRLNAYNAVRYVLENYMNPTTYTLSNYSSTINTNKTIASDASYFDELNGFYKLNVTYAKSYEFISSAASGIEVTLYDEDFTEIPFNDLDSTSNKVHFIENLSTGTYYLRTKYVNEDSTGTINTQIVSRTTAYIGVGDNDVLLNTHNYNEGIYPTNYYYYINSRGVGFYRFTLTGVKADGTTVTYPYSSIMIKDHMNEDIIDKYSLTGYSNQAISGYNENTFVAYLNATGYFYVYIDIDTEGLKSLTLNIEPVESETIDLFTKSESTNSTMEILDSETTKGDYAKKIILKQAGEFTVNYSYSGSQSNDILFVLGKLNYNSSTQKYTIETLISQLMDAENDSFTYTLDLTDGTYFVAYFNKDDNAAFDVTFNRLVTQYGGSVLIPDPDSMTDGGSQVEVYEKGLPYYEVSYRGTNIVIGFTRVIYIDYHYVDQHSREDYYWYSSNDSIATISQHGTVFGKSAGTVKIMAVNKDDPSIVFVKQFTVVQDTKTYSEVIYSEFNDTHKLSNGEYQLGLDVQNSPYPMVQYYSWRVVSKSSTITSVSIDQWGNVTITGTGNVVIEGYNYIYNNNYGVRINLTVTN